MTKEKKKKDGDEFRPSQYRGSKEDQLQALYAEWYGCKRCPLGELRGESGCRKRDMQDDLVFASGNPNADIMIIGEGPGEEEDKTLVPFVGPSGVLLNQIITACHPDPGVKNMYQEFYKNRRTQKAAAAFQDKAMRWRDQEFFITNVVSCRPPDNRTPIPPEIKACRERLLNMIYIVDPAVIVACGNTALAALIGKVSLKITSERGKVLDVDLPGRVVPVTYPVIPTFHPSYIARMADYEVKGGTFEKTKSDWRKIYQIASFIRNKHYRTEAYRG